MVRLLRIDRPFGELRENRRPMTNDGGPGFVPVENIGTTPRQVLDAGF
jgi:hypothetical protein